MEKILAIVGELTRESLLAIIPQIDWFSEIGKHPESSDLVIIRSLEPEHEPDEWDWLPTVGFEADLKYAQPLIDLTREQNCEAEAKHFSLTCYKAVLQSLRPVSDRVLLLTAGPHNLTPAAKGAAKFTFRMAAMEILVAQKGFWCSLVPLYANGYWPCGIADNGKIVVF